MENQKLSIFDRLKALSPIKFKKQEEKFISKEITIGLDFGTSTTKCIINIEGSGKDDEYYAILFPRDKDVTLLYPTAISFADGKLYFGDLATTFKESETIYSCKMAVPCKDSWNNYSSPFMCENAPGLFIFDSRYHFSASELSILYLSNVIRVIRELVKKAFPNIKVKFYLNMACPLDQLEKDYFASCTKSDKQAANKENRKRDEYIEQRYNEISQYSLGLSNYSKNPWDINDAYRYINAIQKKILRSPEQSPASIIPETLAAISSFIKRPGTEQGRYMAIDVGAGTTDISVFWLEKNSVKSKPHYYSSGSLHIGVDQFDTALREILNSYEGNSLRERREKLVAENVGLSNCKDEIEPHLCKMIDHRTKFFGYAYHKEAKQSIWGNKRNANLTIVFFGGGSKLDVIKERFIYSDIWENILGQAEHILPKLEVCNHAITPNGSLLNIDEHKDIGNDSSLLLIAEGLASRIIDIPEYGIQAERIYEPKSIEFDIKDY
ncbi:MAG: hypothetical protein NTW93_00500 [Phycisphaerae bacterium]|nr:hypothetical protein [Phycisphaerae bacterium]